MDSLVQMWTSKFENTAPASYFEKARKQYDGLPSEEKDKGYDIFKPHCDKCKLNNRP